MLIESYGFINQVKHTLLNFFKMLIYPINLHAGFLKLALFAKKNKLCFV